MNNSEEKVRKIDDLVLHFNSMLEHRPDMLNKWCDGYVDLGIEHNLVNILKELLIPLTTKEVEHLTDLEARVVQAIHTVLVEAVVEGKVK